MPSQLDPVEDDSGAVYRILVEEGPLSIQEIAAHLEDEPDYRIESDLGEGDADRIKEVIRSLVEDGHVVHHTSFDDDENVRWEATERPDLNPKPDGRNTVEETPIGGD